MVHMTSKEYSSLKKDLPRILIGFPLQPILKTISPYLMKTLEAKRFTVDENIAMSSV